MTDVNKHFLQDEELSDFTDRVLKGQMNNTASDSHKELDDLEETVLRLHSTMPSSSLEESEKKQMLARLNARIRKEQTQRKSFWASIFNIEWLSRPQFVTAIGIIALLLIVVIVSPILGIDGSSTTIGTALSEGQGFILPAVLLGLIILILWIKRK